MILRHRQDVFVGNCCKALDKHGDTLGVANTGFGKTVALSAVVGRQINGDGRALVVAHRDELTRQNSDTFKRVCPDHSISFYDAKRKSWRGRVTFSMIQTIANQNNIENMPRLDLLVYDEAHHAASNSYRRLTEKVRAMNPKAKILGVTATPDRGDRKGLGETFSNVADIVTIGEMVRDGFLVPPRAKVIDIGTQDKLRSVKKTANDYNQSEVEVIQNTAINNNQIVETWFNEASERNTVAFCSTIKHAIDVRNSFREMNVYAESVHGDMPVKERRAILAAYDRGEIQVLTNPMILTEGWDCQICSCVMLLRIESHKSTMIQMVGRGLRKVDPRRYPGRVKKDCLVLDFGISLITHGDLNANVKLRHDVKADPEAKRTKNCPACKAELPIQARECLLCGYEFKIEIDESGYYNELAELKMIEIDILEKSPFRWVSLFDSDQVLISPGFNGWACVCSTDEENWFGIGCMGREIELLTVSNRIAALASANDFMRQNETSSSSKKAANWQVQQASQKQMWMLERFGYSGYFNKAEAAAHITFCYNRSVIEKVMGL